MASESPLLELRDISCRRSDAALSDITLSFERGSLNLFLGETGAPLLLRVAGLLEAPDAGEIHLEGASVQHLSEQERGALRSRRFGYVFPSPCLLPGLSSLENVAMPLLKILNTELNEACSRTLSMLEFLGWDGDCEKAIGDLSRLNQQILALARALIHRPAVLVLDRAETYLSLDEAATFQKLVRKASADLGVMVLATLASSPARFWADRIIAVESGVISELSAPSDS